MVLAPEVAVGLSDYYPSLPSTEDLTGLENSLPMHRTSLPGKLVLVIGRRPQFLVTQIFHGAVSMSLWYGSWLCPQLVSQETAK